MANLLPGLSPPTLSTSTEIFLSDIFEGHVHCPFCGASSGYHVKLEFHATPCEHMLAFYADDEHQYISKRLIDQVREYGLPLDAGDEACTIGDQTDASWPLIFMSGIVPYSVIFSQSFDVEVDLISIHVAFAPIITLEETN
jgi:hypothetical protein